MVVPFPIQPQGQINTMMELKVTLDFACCHCAHQVGVTLKCEGKGLAEGHKAVASVNVPCPTCGTINQLYFRPSGTVQAVAPYRAPRQMPVPSLN
jgi:phage FluMu protein Com